MSASEQTSASKRDSYRIKQKFLSRTSFKNISGNYQFNGGISPNTVFNIAEELFDVKIVAIAFAEYLEKQGEYYDWCEEKTHTLSEHYEHFKKSL